MIREMDMLIGEMVQVTQDSCEGNYSDLIGSKLVIVDQSEDEGMEFCTVYAPDRLIQNEMLEENEEIIFIGDLKLVNEE